MKDQEEITPVFCDDGNVDQTAPACPTTCAAENDCEASCTCYKDECIVLQPNGSPCDNNDNCDSDYCANGFCCDGFRV